MHTLALASSLWLAAAGAGSRPDALQEPAVIMAVVPVEDIADESARDMYWLVGGHAADLYSTAWALERCPTCLEGNPLGPTPEARIALKMASTASLGLIMFKLRRSGHGRAASLVRWSTVALHAIVTANNTRHALRR